VLHTLLKQQVDAELQERAEFERLSAEAIAKGEAPLKKPKRKDPTNARNFKAATPGALILCLTRELAQQVCADAIDLVRHCRGLRVANVVVGIPYQFQIAKLQNANLVAMAATMVVEAVISLPVKNAALRLAKTVISACATKVSRHALTLMTASQADSPSQQARCLCPVMPLRRLLNSPSQHATEFDPGFAAAFCMGLNTWPSICRHHSSLVPVSLTTLPQRTNSWAM